MSITSFPRLYFKGDMSFDPSLSNNFEIYDQSNVTLDMDELKAAVPGATTLEQFRRGLPQALRRSWNHYGTHRAVFESNMQVTGVSLKFGEVETTDALVQRQVKMKGKLVDLSPHTDNGTQVFFDQVQFGGVGAGMQLAGRKRMTCRYLNFARNIGPNPGWPAYSASGTWEVAFPKEALRMQGVAASPFLSALERLLSSDPSVLGVAMRFRTYRTLYYQNGIKNSSPEQPRTGDELRALYADGKNFSNPVYSMVVGSLFPWVDGDHDGHPGGRMLVAASGVPSVGSAADPVGLGTAFVEFDRANERMVLDFGDLVPEMDQALVKASIGDIAVIAQDGQTNVPLALVPPSVPLGVIDPNSYDQAAYERTAGLVDLDLKSRRLQPAQWDVIARGSLALVVEQTVAMLENPLIVIVSDRDHYVDQGEGVSIAIRVMYHGRPAPAGTQVLVTAYDVKERRPALLQSLGTVSVDVAGSATISVGAAPAPSFVAIAFRPFLAGDPAPAETPDDVTEFHALIRTLPFDDQLEANTPDSMLTWSWVYDNILAVWDVTNPVMARNSGPSINKPLHDRTTMESQASRIKKLIARSNMESESYMPVTRDLSRGKRRLLERWCDLVIAGKAPHEPVQGQPGHSVPTMSTRVLPEE
ncbi:hypothetical protein [Polaromonas sp. CG_9.11]|uniref:hypothetical protein n=1 Tax=Polaromonas sp. CG_9.11 TaxID=2787730 RepID=UPI0018CB6A31|nr:hypothetical protein [Polaromonas sp. CG_9.11]MBG6077806.1 hypothetical protein [Polaromonas sp. CG_9.11]